MSTKNYDLIVIGNGVLSYSTVFAISQENPDLKIAVVGPKNKIGSASIAAGAMLACFAEVEKGGLDSEIARTKFEMSRKSAEMWPAWAERINQAIGEKFLNINFGTYVIHNTRADELDDENFDALLETLKEFDEPHELVDPRSIKGMSPSTESRTTRAVYIPREGSFPSERLAEALEKAFTKSPNIELVDDFAEKLTLEDGGSKLLSTRGGLTLKSQTLLIAAGAESQKFVDQIPQISKKIPRVVYGVGTGVVVKTDSHSPEKVVRTSNRGLACGVHVVPYDKDVCYIGASNFISPVPEYSPRMTSLFALLQSAMEQIHTRFYKGQVLRWVVGHRPTSVDTYPLLGETSVPGLWLMSGTKRDGIHMSPFYCQSLALEILGRKGLFTNPFKPERKPIHTMTREEGIAKAIKHLKSAGYQHELRLPKAGWDDMVNDMLRAKVEAIYDKCGIKDFGIPVEMLDMYKYGHAGHEA